MSNESMTIDYANNEALQKAWDEIVTSIQQIENNPHNYIFAVEKFANAFSTLHTEHGQDAGSDDFGNAIIALSKKKKITVTQAQGEKAVSICSSFGLYLNYLYATKNKCEIEAEHKHQLSQTDSELQKRHGLIRSFMAVIPSATQLPDGTQFNADINTSEDYEIPKYYHAYHAYPDFINALKAIDEFPTKEISPAIATEIKKIANLTKQLAKTAKPKEMDELTELLKRTHTALTSKNAENAITLAAQGKRAAHNAKWKLLGSAAMILGGLLLIGASIAAAMVSFGALAPLSMGGIVVGANIIAAGIAVGIGASAAVGVGYGLGGNTSFFKKQWQRNSLERSAEALKDEIISPSKRNVG